MEGCFDFDIPHSTQVTHRLTDYQSIYLSIYRGGQLEESDVVVVAMVVVVVVTTKTNKQQHLTRMMMMMKMRHFWRLWREVKKMARR
jgi:hypothetical protein